MNMIVLLIFMYRLKKTPKQRHFSVQDDIVFFAPGAIYPILPLFVEESGDKGCDGKLLLSMPQC